MLRKPSELCLAWWKKFPEAWEACRRDTVDPQAAMKDYVSHLEQLGAGGKRLTFMAYPIEVKRKSTWLTPGEIKTNQINGFEG